MSLLAVAIVVAVVAVPVNGVRACCYPPQMEGAKYNVEDKEMRYFVADYDLGYVFQTGKIGGSNFTILDLFNQKIYTVRGTECEETKMPVPGLFDPCLHTDEMIRKNVIFGGDGQTLTVDLYEYKVEPFSMFKAVKMERNGCIPVTTQLSLEGETLTSLYDNVHTKISFPGIFSALNRCNVKVRRW